jgi:hypothetical protein
MASGPTSSTCCRASTPRRSPTACRRQYGRQHSRSARSTRTRGFRRPIGSRAGAADSRRPTRRRAEARRSRLARVTRSEGAAHCLEARVPTSRTCSSRATIGPCWSTIITRTALCSSDRMSPWIQVVTSTRQLGPGDARSIEEHEADVEAAVGIDCPSVARHQG